MNIIKFIVSIVLVLNGFAYCQAQSREMWIRDEVVSFENYKWLDEKIKNKKFVFIGESSHGAKEFFECRSEIVGYLVKNHDFKVLLVESPMAASYLYENEVENRVDSLSHSQHIFFPIFCNNIMDDLVAEMDAQDIPIWGFDIQLGTKFQSEFGTEFLYEIIGKVDQEFAAEFKAAHDLFSRESLVRFNRNERWYDYPCNTIANKSVCEYWLNRYTYFLRYLNNRKSVVFAACDYDLMKMHVLFTQVEAVRMDLETMVNSSGLEVRDSLMARNIQFLVDEEFPDQKIILLAHNTHIFKNIRKVDSDLFEGTRGNIISYLPKKMISESLFVGLYGVQGASNSNTREKISFVCDTLETSTEYILKTMEFEKALIDCQKYPFSNYLSLCHWGAYQEQYNPRDQFDFIVFIKDVEPSDYLD